MKKLLFTLLSFVLFATTTQAQIVITEIMYNIPGSGEDAEFVEIYNAGTNAVSLDGYTMEDNNDTFHIFPTGTSLSAGGYYVVAYDSTLVVDSLGGVNVVNYNQAANYSGTFGLANGGDRIVIKDASSNVVDTVAYDDGGLWPSGSSAGQVDGGGASLVLCNPANDNNIGSSWTASTTNTVFMNGQTFTFQASPGAADAACPTALEVNFATTAVSVNENVGTVTVDVTITNPNANPTSVDVIVNAASTATGGGTDYTYTSPTTVTFPASSTATQSVTVTIIDDALMESAETIVVELTNATNGAALGTDSLQTITINDNDTPLADLVITEIMYNQSGVDTLEFIEIYNNGLTTANLSGYYFDQGVTYTFPAGTMLPAGSYWVVALDSAFYNSLFGATVAQWTSGSLANGGEDIVIKSNTGVTIDSVDYGSAAPWPSVGGGNVSIQLDDVVNDNNDPANWCLSTNNTGALANGQPVLATPSAMNSACPLPPPPGTYNLTTIDAANDVDGSGIPVALGDSVELRGIVHCTTFQTGRYDFALIESTYDGIRVFEFNTVNGYTVNGGDSLHIFGRVDQFNGLTQLRPDSIVLVSSGNATLTPMAVTALNESTENSIVELQNANLVDAAQWTTGTSTSGNGFNVQVLLAGNTTDTLELRITETVDLYNQAPPAGTFNIYGIGTQFDPSAPHDEGYQLQACNSSITVSTTNIAAQNNEVSIFPNPASDVLNVRANNIDMIVITNVMGQEVVRMNNVTTNATTVNTSDLATGIYNITVVSNGTLTTKQFVKK